MCEEFYDEFNKLRRQLNEDEKQYLKEAKIAIIQRAYPGRGYRMWRQTTNATFYKHKNNKAIKVYGLYDVYNKCIIEHE